MSSPVSYNISKKDGTLSKDIGSMLGTSVSYNISKRFALSFNYKINLSTVPNSPMLSFFLIGSRMNL
jgi:hypothetical protein